MTWRRPGGSLVSFEVPQWFGDFLKENLVRQYGYRTNPLNQQGMAPKIVDPRQPGLSVELPPPWSEWLQEYAVPGSGRTQ